MTDSEGRLVHSSAKLAPHQAGPRTKTDTFLFSYEYSSAAQTSTLGSLHIIIEMPHNDTELKKLCDVITETIGQNYYNHGEGNDLPKRFEAALGAANRQIKALDDPKLAQSLHGMSAIVAIVSDSQIMMARSANANALLLRGQKLHHVFAVQPPKEQANKVGFVDFASGDIYQNDKIALVSPAVLIDASTEELIAPLNQTSASLVIQNVHKLLSSKPNTSRHGVIAIDIARKAEAAEAPLPEAPSVIHTTEALPLHQKLLRSAQPIAIKAAQKSKHHFNRAKQATKTKVIPSATKKAQSGWNTLWTRVINKNPKLFAAISIGTILLIALLIGTVIRPKSSLNADLAAYKAVNTSYLSAQARFGEGDKAAAETKLAEASNQIDTLRKISNTAALDKQVKKDKSITEKIATATLLAQIATLSDKITSTVRLDGQNLLTTNKTIKATTYAGTSVYVLDESGTISSYDTTNKSIKTIVTKIPASSVIASTYDTLLNRIYYLTSSPSVWQVDLNTRSSSELQLSSGEWPAANDISYYNGAIYLLSNDSHQITKHFPTAIGFGPGVPYFKTALPASTNLTALAINGGVYVADNTSAISLYLLGVKKNFSVTGLPKSLGWADQMIIAGRGNQISGLTNKHDRIFIITLSDEEGSFAKQYALKNNASFTSFATNESQTTYYVASENKLISFTAK